MSKQIMKPVWRVNSGSGVHSDFSGELVLARFLKVLDVRKSKEFKSRAFWLKKSDDYRPLVIAYQTTRTKAAKYERVECVNCAGCGKAISSYTNSEQCRKCNGKGYKLEVIK